MSALLEKIRSRGYWRVVIRPTTFIEKRVHEKSTLGHILKSRSVSIKGWNFPHVDYFRDFDEGSDWIGQEIETGPILELWRFYQSGQFVHYFGMAEDWVESPDHYLPIGNRHQVVLRPESIVTRFTEVFELAARLTFTEVGDAGTCMEIAAVNISDHVLPLPTRHRFVPMLEAHESEVTIKMDPTSTELVGENRELALEAALQFFQHFGWNPSIELLRDIQMGILDREQVRGPFVIG